MSLEAHWFSTIYGVYFFSGTILAALAATTLIVVLMHENGYLPGLRKDHFYSLGALMFGFVNFWAYIAFSQFLLIWYANLPEETYWFMARWENGWQIVSVLLIVVQFVVPYIVLLAAGGEDGPAPAEDHGDLAAGRAAHRPVLARHADAQPVACR